MQKRLGSVLAFLVAHLLLNFFDWLNEGSSSAFRQNGDASNIMLHRYRMAAYGQIDISSESFSHKNLAILIIRKKTRGLVQVSLGFIDEFPLTLKTLLKSRLHFFVPCCQLSF